jgi:hypothetical protein
MNNFTKRMLAGGALGVLAGTACAYGAASHGVPGAFDFSNAMFWSIVFNRFTLGAVIGMMGVFTMHPIFYKLKIGPVLRGLDGGLWISLLMAVGILMSPTNSTISAEQWSGFWYTLIAGAIIGIVIDLIITKRYGQGSDLIDYQK